MEKYPVEKQNRVYVKENRKDNETSAAVTNFESFYNLPKGIATA